MSMLAPEAAARPKPRFSKPPASQPPTNSGEWVQATLVRREQGHGCDEFTFRLAHGRMEVPPSGHVLIRVDGAERPYSPVACRGSEIDVAVKCYPDGTVTPRLFALSPGERVLVRGPFQGAMPKTVGPDFVFAAAGTGIAPFFRPIEAAVRGGKATVWLIHSVRLPDEAVLSDRIAALERESGGRLKVLSAWTRAGAGPEDGVPTVCGRRLTEQDFRGFLPAPRGGLTAAVCGTPAWNTSAAAALKALGFGPVVLGADEPAATVAPTGQVQRKGYTAAEVAQHCTEGDLWVIINGDIYDLSQRPGGFRHPGGVPVMLKQAGKDATRAFYSAHPWIDLNAVTQYRIGWLTRSLSDKRPQSKSPQKAQATDAARTATLLGSLGVAATGEEVQEMEKVLAQTAAAAPTAGGAGAEAGEEEEGLRDVFEQLAHGMDTVSRSSFTSFLRQMGASGSVLERMQSQLPARVDFASFCKAVDAL
eukprot:Hpha_TRINITY_DN28011_c0_g1::TRINITY_DN28011_c0_g1_i1::g.42553::m.42553